MIKTLLSAVGIRREYSHKSKELKYWKDAGKAKGNEFYNRYIEAFGLKKDYFNKRSVGDFGSGPFGGVTSVIGGHRSAYPIDILADEYNEMGLSGEHIMRFDGKKTALPSGCMDIIFCCNAIDHTAYPGRMINEIHRLLSPAGELFLSVHMRERSQVNMTHPIAWNEGIFRRLFRDFKVEWMRIEDTDKVNECGYRTLYAKLVK